MSHLAVKKTKPGEPLIVDLNALKLAVARLGLMWEERAKFRWWESSVGDYPIPDGFKEEELGNNATIVVFIPPEIAEKMAAKNWNRGLPYELGVVADPFNPDCYVLMYDFMSGGFGLDEYIGAPVYDENGQVVQLAPLLMQQYRMFSDKLAADEVGDEITFETLEDGSYVSYTKVDENRLLSSL